MGIDGMSMDIFNTYSIPSCFSTQQSQEIYIIIFRNILLILYGHMFLIECQLGVHTLKDKRRAKEKLRLYKAIESK